MTRKTKAELEAEIVALKKEKSKLEKSTKKASKKSEKVQTVADGFHTVGRISSLTGGKDIKISAIVKNNEITGYFLANMFPNYDGRAKGLHIPKSLTEVVFDKLSKVEVSNL